MLYFIGLYLLHLLANNRYEFGFNNRTTDFCTELELLEISDLNNEYIKVSRDLEQCIMEGNYKHIFGIRNSLSDQNYKYYLDKFDDAIRFQIARSSEKSFESLKVNDAVGLLNLRDQNELARFIKHELETLEVREIEWQIVSDRLHFIPVSMWD
jgi:26S proteasome regulatory subunit N12